MRSEDERHPAAAVSSVSVFSERIRWSLGIPVFKKKNGIICWHSLQPTGEYNIVSDQN